MNSAFQQNLIEAAGRIVNFSQSCNNEESTKLFLILPFLSFLGYDPTNPNEVFPEHHADFSEKYRNRVDFAILKDNAAIIAIECKANGCELKDERGQLRSYFNAAKSVRMGILSNGLAWEFYTDSNEPNLMDEAPFLSIDLREIAKGKTQGSALEALNTLRKSSFDPDNIGDAAKRKHVFNSVLAQINEIAEEPTEQFCRLLLQNAGLTHLRQKTLDEYKDVVQRAFREFVNQTILTRLALPKSEIDESALEPSFADTAPQKIVTTETELAVFRWVQQRLAFLVEDDEHFHEIKNIGFRDYQGKFIVFYAKERKGRLFCFVEGAGNNPYKFIFPDDVQLGRAELVTSSLKDLDDDLLYLFKARVAALRGQADASKSAA